MEVDEKVEDDSKEDATKQINVEVNNPEQNQDKYIVANLEKYI